MMSKERKEFLKAFDHDPMTDDPKIASLIFAAEKEAKKIIEEDYQKSRSWLSKLFFPHKKRPMILGTCHNI